MCFLAACCIMVCSMTQAVYAQPIAYDTFKGAQVWEIQDAHLTPVHIAAAKGDVNGLKKLIQQNILA